MRITGIVTSQMESRTVERKDGTAAQVDSIKVLDDSTGDVVEVNSWKPDTRLVEARKGDEVDFTAKSWSAYRERLRIEVAPA